MQHTHEEYNRLLHILQRIWKGNYDMLADNLKVDKATVSRLLSGKTINLFLIAEIADMSGITLSLNLEYRS